MNALLLSMAALSAPAVSAWGALITHTFEPGDLEGWTQVDVGSAGDPGFDPAIDDVQFNATGSTFGSRMVWADPVGDLGGITITNPAGTADYRATAHNSGILRSPTFTLNGVNAAAPLTNTETVTEISFDLLGGSAPTAPTNVGSLPVATFNRPSGNLGGFMGVALRRVSDDEYLTWSTRSGNGQSNAGSPLGWETLTLDSIALAAAISGDPVGELYTLDLIDAADGDWGFVSMDNASFTTVPEPASVAAFLGFAALGLVLSRRRRSVS